MKQGAGPTPYCYWLAPAVGGRIAPATSKPSSCTLRPRQPFWKPHCPCFSELRFVNTLFSKSPIIVRSGAHLPYDRLESEIKMPCLVDATSDNLTLFNASPSASNILRNLLPLDLTAASKHPKCSQEQDWKDYRMLIGISLCYRHTRKMVPHSAHI